MCVSDEEEDAEGRFYEKFIYKEQYWLNFIYLHTVKTEDLDFSKPPREERKPKLEKKLHELPHHPVRATARKCRDTIRTFYRRDAFSPESSDQDISSPVTKRKTRRCRSRNTATEKVEGGNEYSTATSFAPAEQPELEKKWLIRNKNRKSQGSSVQFAELAVTVEVIYDLDSGMLLATICMDVPLTSVLLDTLEYYVFLGAKNGSIYKINTYEKNRSTMQVVDEQENENGKLSKAIKVERMDESDDNSSLHRPLPTDGSTLNRASVFTYSSMDAIIQSIRQTREEQLNAENPRRATPNPPERRGIKHLG